VKRIIACVWLAATLLSGSRASAQPPLDPSPPPTESDHGLKTAMMAWSAGVIADQITTFRFSSRYSDVLHERNPLIAEFNGHPLLLVTTGSAMDAATGWAVYKLLGHRHPRLAKIAFVGAAAYRSYLAAYNVQMMQRAQQIRSMTPR
jgi:hypothetical protein